MAAYVPARGDLIWLQFNPQAGHEQAGHRPAVVISPSSYSRRVGLVLCCPITSQVKGYPFEVLLPQGLGVEEAILADQIKSLHWCVRKARRIGSLPADLLQEAVGKSLALVDPDGLANITMDATAPSLRSATAGYREGWPSHRRAATSEKGMENEAARSDGSSALSATA